MWLGQAKFFCTRCGKEVTDHIRHLIEQRCQTHSIDPGDLAEKAAEVAKTEMLLDLGEEPANPEEFAFIKATALLLLEFAYSPILLCDQCRSRHSRNGTNANVKLQLIQGGKRERK